MLSRASRHVVLVLWAASAFAIMGCAKDGTQCNNAVVVSVDTLRRAALRAFDRDAPELPNVDRFATQAVRFMNAHSTAPWTLPAHASLLTGLYPDRHGATDRRQRLDARVSTLADLLHRSGFETVAFTDGGYVHPAFGFDSGFERYDDWVQDPNYRASLNLPRDGKPSPTPGSVLFDRAIAFLEQRTSKDPPLFLFLHTFAVHQYPKIRSWARISSQQHGGKVPARTPAYYWGCVLGRRHCTGEEWRDLERLYEGEVENLDRGFGRLLAVLEVKKLLASTLIVFVSDHGEGFDADLGRTHHGGRMHEDQLRIPLLIGGPCVVPGVVEEPVSLVDIMPTILDLFGLEVPGNLDGDSLVALLEGRPHQRSRPLYAMEHFFWWERGGRFSAESVREDPVQLAVVAGGWWYIRGRSREELYEMTTDPGQQKNLAGDSEKIQRMRQLASSRSEYRVRRHPLELDPRLQEQLRALGYLR